MSIERHSKFSSRCAKAKRETALIEKVIAEPVPLDAVKILFWEKSGVNFGFGTLHPTSRNAARLQSRSLNFTSVRVKVAFRTTAQKNPSLFFWLHLIVVQLVRFKPSRYLLIWRLINGSKCKGIFLSRRTRMKV